MAYIYDTNGAVLHAGLQNLLLESLCRDLIRSEYRSYETPRALLRRFVRAWRLGDQRPDDCVLMRNGKKILMDLKFSELLTRQSN